VRSTHRCLLLVVLAALLPRAAPAQERSTRSGFAFGLSLGVDQARDDLLAPLRWTGPGLGIRLAWDRETSRSRHEASLGLPVSLYQNRFDHKGLTLGLDATYGYVRTVRGPGGEVAAGQGPTGPDVGLGSTLALGAHVRYDLHDGWYGSWDEEHGYWFTALGLGPRVSWSALPGPGWRLGATLDVPVAALVARPPRYRLTKVDPLTSLSYHVVDTNRHMRWATVPDYLAAHAAVRFTRSRGSGLALGFDVDFATYDAPERVVTLTYRVHVSRRVAW